jgi:hypothetical protein
MITFRKPAIKMRVKHSASQLQNQKAQLKIKRSFLPDIANSANYHIYWQEIKFNISLPRRFFLRSRFNSNTKNKKDPLE